VFGNHLDVQPSVQSFEWNGAENYLTFLVTVASESTERTHLVFEASIQAVPVFFMPVELKLTPGAMSEPTVVTGRPMSTAFASYSAQDGTRVKQCLSALKHWDPDVEVFIDCLDLRPNDDWKRQLEYEIPTKDAFLLFWSVNAMKSKCVAWEISVAEAKRGLAYIRPMPLDMPDLAPPPERLKHLHFSDRYLAAQQANWMRQSSGLAWLSELQRVTIGAFRRAFGG